MLVYQRVINNVKMMMMMTMMMINMYIDLYIIYIICHPPLKRMLFDAIDICISVGSIL